jgi:hypothetical protein
MRFFGVRETIAACCIRNLRSVFLPGSSADAGTLDLHADDIQIPSTVRVLTFKTPVKTVFVGNPVIADITVIDPMHVFILQEFR